MSWIKWSLVALFFVAILVLPFSCQQQPYQQGEILYNNFCTSCHMEDGTGLVGNIPPLVGADYVKEDPLRMACIIRKGIEDTIVVNGVSYNQPMAAIPQLTEFEITNVINYINHAWGNDYGVVKLGDVRARLEACD